MAKKPKATRTKKPERKRPAEATSSKAAFPAVSSAAQPAKVAPQPGGGQPLSITTQEFVRRMAEQTRSHRVAAAVTLGVLVLAGVGVAIWATRSAAKTPPPEIPASEPESTEAETPGAPPTARASKEALRKAPKSIASLMNGPRQASHASPQPAIPEGAVHSPRLNAYDLARSIANDRRGAVQLCYEHELKRDPRLRGRLTVDVQLKAPHEIGEIRVVDNLKRESFTRCVQGAMRHLDFPPLREDLSIEIPFALTSPDL